MEIFLHLGVHKTASTFLQRTLAINEAQLADKGVFLARHRNPTGSPETQWDPLLGAFREFTRSRRSRAAHRRELAKRLSAYEKRAASHGIGKLVLSDENMLGASASWYLTRGARPIWGRKPSFYPFSAELAQLVSEVLNPSRVTVLICTREQHTLFRSLWLDGVFQLRLDVTLRDFVSALERHGWSRYRFDRLVWPWYKAFGRENVHVLPYESILASPMSYAKGFLSAARIDCDPITVPSGAVNKSIDARRAATARLLAREINRGGNAAELSRAFREGVPPLVANWNEIIDLDEPAERIVKEEFGEDLSYRLSRSLQKDLARWTI